MVGVAVGAADGRPDRAEVVPEPRWETDDAVLDEILGPHHLAGGQWTDDDPGQVGK